MIPKSVKHADLMAALEPLCELLGTTPMHIYGNPPLTIGGPDRPFSGDLGHIVFAHVPAEPDLAGEYPKSVPATVHPQGDEAAELVTIVTVEVV